MDYFETFFTLIDIMAEAYYKLLVGTEGPICTQSYFELVLKCDGKFKVKTKQKDGFLCFDNRKLMQFHDYRKL